MIRAGCGSVALGLDVFCGKGCDGMGATGGACVREGSQNWWCLCARREL